MIEIDKINLQTRYPDEFARIITGGRGDPELVRDEPDQVPTCRTNVEIVAANARRHLFNFCENSAKDFVGTECHWFGK